MAWPVTPVATGDLVTAAQLNQLPIALAEATGAAASYTFSSIPQVWTHLLIVGALQSGSGNNTNDLWLRINGDTSTKYISQYMKAVDTTVSADGVNSDTKIIAGIMVGGASGSYSSNEILIANYAVAQGHSVVGKSHASYGNTLDNNQVLALAGGAWIPVTPAAVTSITLLPSAGSFVAGSIATLYGLGAI